MTSLPWRGIVPAVITPFQADEKIDFQAWQHLFEVLLASGVHGVLVLGGQGEFYALTEEERTVAARFCVQTVARRVPVYANIGAVTTRETVRLARQAEADGVDCLVAITPYYVCPSEDELLDHYTEICRSVRIPVLAYNYPERTGVSLNPNLLRRAAELSDNLLGVKDCSGRLEDIPLYQAAGLTVFMGLDHLILEGFRRNCVGAMSACANLVPCALVEVYTAFEQGKPEQAQPWQAVLDALRDAGELASYPSAIKEALNLLGLPAGSCRRPIGAVPAAARARLAEIVSRLQAAGYGPVQATRRLGA